MTPDVNVLVAASRSDHPHHAVASDWLEGANSASRDGAPRTLMSMVVASFLGRVTNPRIFHTVNPTTNAVAFIDAILATPGVELAPPGPGVAEVASTVPRHAADRQRPPRCLAVRRRAATGRASGDL